MIEWFGAFDLMMVLRNWNILYLLFLCFNRSKRGGKRNGGGEEKEVFLFTYVQFSVQ